MTIITQSVTNVKLSAKKVDNELHCVDTLGPRYRLAGATPLPTMPFKASAVQTGLRRGYSDAKQVGGKRGGSVDPRI